MDSYAGSHFGYLGPLLASKGKVAFGVCCYEIEMTWEKHYLGVSFEKEMCAMACMEQIE